jgi:uncharacterized membrane protein
VIKQQLAAIQAEHRMQLENKIVVAQIRQNYTGQWMALFIAAFAITASVVVTLHGESAVGWILGGSTVVALAGVFIVGKVAQNKELAEKKGGRRIPNPAVVTLERSGGSR